MHGTKTPFLSQMVDMPILVMMVPARFESAVHLGRSSGGSERTSRAGSYTGEGTFLSTGESVM